LILSPSWTTHFACVEFAEAKPIEVPCGETFKLDEEALKQRLTKKTKMIIVSSPNNPTGGVMSEEDLRAIADVAEDHKLYVLSDEIYNQIVYDGLTSSSMGSFKNIKNQVIGVNGFSKTYAMTGWRLGYVFAEKNMLTEIDKIVQANTTCPSSFVQKAAIAALKGPKDCLKKMIRGYDQRRKFMVSKFREIPGIRCEMPRGAFYVFPDFSSLKMPSLEMCLKLLEEEGVSCTPGSIFGTSGENHIRFSYAASPKVISEGLEKVKQFVSRAAKIGH
jgi:aspartate/methionine/tyrosine aminotransferase